MVAHARSAEPQATIDRDFEASRGAFGFTVSEAIVAAFSGFDLRFTHSDEHLQEIALARFARSGYNVMMRDRGHDDPIRGSVHLVDVATLGTEQLAHRLD